MQINAVLLSLFVAGAIAMPGSPVQERQASPTVYVKYFAGTGCNDATNVEDQVINQASEGTGCNNESITNAYQSALFRDSTLTRKLRIYKDKNCNDSGVWYDFTVGTPFACIAQHVGSWKFF